MRDDLAPTVETNKAIFLQQNPIKSAHTPICKNHQNVCQKH